MAGYAHELYARSLSQFGEPYALTRSGTWILKRSIPDSLDHDGMGCYPLLACRDWAQLPTDLKDLERDLVCVSGVLDPFGDYDLGLLSECFDRVLPFKEHFVIDLGRSQGSYISPHHRRNARKALRAVHVEACADPPAALGEWADLYSLLVQRHELTGIRAFSRSAFARQLAVPGIAVFRATHAGRAVGMLLWYEQGDVAYYHLGAFNTRGYELGASFALFWTAIEFFTDSGIHWIDLGSGAGLSPSEADGLSRFKRGWSTDTRSAYFCSRIFNARRYAALVTATGTETAAYFPAYRSGEFGGSKPEPDSGRADTNRGSGLLTGASVE